MRRVRAVVAATMCALLCTTPAAMLAATPADANPGGVDPNSVAIIAVHGFDSQECPGSDASYGWIPFDYVLRQAGYTGRLLPVSYYACDEDGADISGYGPDAPTVANPDVTPERTRAGYRQDTPIATLAHDLAWYVYRNFTVHGQPVDIVSLSMGGLMARTALLRVQEHDPTFPPELRVQQSITFSTPHRGLGTVAGNTADPGCRGMLQCTEWATDSPLMTELVRDGTDPQGTGGTRWTVIGSSAGCDFLPTDSALGLPGALQIDLTAPCYSHIGYFWDIEAAHDATAVVRDGADAAPVTITDAPHSLTLATILLQNPPTAPVPASPPVPEAVVTPLPAVTLAPWVTVDYRSSSTDASPAFDVRYRAASGSDDAGPWIEPATLRNLAAGRRSLHYAAGTTQFCVSVRGRDGEDVSAWSAATCTATTLDDRALQRSTDWEPVRSATAVAGTLSRSTRAGATASRTVRGRSVTLVVRSCADCGALRVLLDGRPWRTVDTRATTAHRSVVTLPAWATERTVLVTLRAASSRPVYLDGLAVSR